MVDLCGFNFWKMYYLWKMSGCSSDGGPEKNVERDEDCIPKHIYQGVHFIEYCGNVLRLK